MSELIELEPGLHIRPSSVAAIWISEVTKEVLIQADGRTFAMRLPEDGALHAQLAEALIALGFA